MTIHGEPRLAPPRGDATPQNDPVADRIASLRQRRAQGVEGDRTRAPSRKQRANQWMRWTHVYVSMFALLAILFFGLTGLTLNHPDWTFGSDVRQSTIEGTLPESVIVDDELELLMVSEFFRSEHDIGGEITAFDASTSNGTLNYRGPGYAADAQFDAGTLAYSISVQQEGFVAVMNDIHRGSDTGSAWSWVIDLSAGFLVVVALTGLVIQFLMRKRRTRALIVAGTGAVIAVIMIWVATA